MTSFSRYIVVFFFVLTGFVFPQLVNSDSLVWPKAPDKSRIKFLYSFSSKDDFGITKSFFEKLVDFFLGEEKEISHLERPQNIAINSRGELLITDIELKGIHFFNIEEKTYKFVKKWGKNLFNSPVGIAIDNEDDIFICDSGIKKIIVLDKGLNFKHVLKEGLIRPTSIKIENDSVYVSDTGANQIIVFNLEGKELQRIGGRGNAAGSFNFPVHLCLDNSKNPSTNSLYVVDAMNFRIQVLSKAGVFIKSFGRLGNSVGDFARPKGVALDSESNVYVVDALFDIVQIFDQTGQVLLAFGGSGSGKGNFYLPTDILIDNQDKIYIVDSGNRRIQVFQYLK
ncbi:MAG: 6-bladed beta-propeller [Ignavibacteria bacterium]|nr:6-bladed beta-propeller [Ignavibacteria bacterium]